MRDWQRSREEEGKKITGRGRRDRKRNLGRNKMKFLD
jgi:hypothetical protein